MDNLADYIRPVVTKTPAGPQQKTTEKLSSSHHITTVRDITTPVQPAQWHYHNNSTYNSYLTPSRSYQVSPWQPYLTENSFGVHPGFSDCERMSSSTNLSMVNWLPTVPEDSSDETGDYPHELYNTFLSDLLSYSPYNNNNKGYQSHYSQNYLQTPPHCAINQKTMVTPRCPELVTIQQTLLEDTDQSKNCDTGSPTESTTSALDDQIHSFSKQLSHDYVSYLNASLQTRNTHGKHYNPCSDDDASPTTRNKSDCSSSIPELHPGLIYQDDHCSSNSRHYNDTCSRQSDHTSATTRDRDDRGGGISSSPELHSGRYYHQDNQPLGNGRHYNPCSDQSDDASPTTRDIGDSPELHSKRTYCQDDQHFAAASTTDRPRFMSSVQDVEDNQLSTASTVDTQMLLQSAMHGLDDFHAGLNDKSAGLISYNKPPRSSFTNKSPSSLISHKRGRNSPYINTTASITTHIMNTTNTETGVHHSVALKVTCEYCKFTARSEAGLKLHQRKCGKFTERKCKYCDQYFRTKYNLRQHLRNVHRKRPQDFKCQLCSETFAMFSELAEHTKLSHMGRYLSAYASGTKARLQEHRMSEHYYPYGGVAYY